MGTVPVPIYVSRGHFALRYEVPKFLPRGGHLCMAMLTIAAMVSTDHTKMVKWPPWARILHLPYLPIPKLVFLT